jgi:hypothetical protein
MARPTIPRDLSEIANRLVEIRRNIDATLAELNDSQPGYPTSTTGGSAPQLSADGKPAGLDRYLNRPDPAATDLRTLTTVVTRIRTDVATLHTIVGTWTAAPITGDDAASSRGSDCQVCTRWVAGTESDRLRAGLCMACYRDWKRAIDANPWVERALWAHQRRARLTDELETSG